MRHVTMQKTSDGGASYPEPCVGALILNDDGEIFLVSSPKWDGRYIIPGGHVEIGETMEQALKREIMEETNMGIEIVRLIHVFDGIFPKEYSRKKHLLLLDFLCRRTSDDELILQKEEADSYIWIRPEQALELDNILASTKELIGIYLEQQARKDYTVKALR